MYSLRFKHLPMASANPMERLLRRRVRVHHSLAVVFTDIENATKINRAIGDLRWNNLCRHHFGIAKRCIRANLGAFVKTIGDSVLAVFAPGADAAKFALDFQDQLRNWNGRRPSGPRVLVRIGLHEGNVAIGKGDISGTEANRASRVAGLAKGAQILASFTARRAVETLGPPWLSRVAWLPLGRKPLKGLENETIFALSWRSVRAKVPVARQRMTPERKIQAKRLVDGSRPKRKIAPTVTNNRFELYRIGADMLADSKSTVITVSTIPDEEFPSRPCPSVANPHIRDYFIALHRVAYRSRLEGERVKLLRYADIVDPDKCQEAISLLYYGSGVEIRPSKVPVEFLSVDDTSVLIGFRGADGLYGGFTVSDAALSQALSSWIQSQADPPEGQKFKSPIALAAYVKGKGGGHGESCLCRIVGELGDVKPSSNHSDGFDAASKWYHGLYAEVGAEHFYSELAKAIRKKVHAPSKRRLNFLDVGCGTGFGSLELFRHNFEYWGLESSKGMLSKVPKNQGPRFCECDAIGALMGVDPHAELFYEGGPAKFDVIACQGNTFDYFLGPVQKALALFLFDASLADGGLLLFTGADLSPLHAKRPRKIVRKVPLAEIEYKIWPVGAYQRLVVTPQVSPKVGTTFVQHACSPVWLRAFLEQMSYKEVNLGVGWFSPGKDPEPMWLTAFRKCSGTN